MKDWIGNKNSRIAIVGYEKNRQENDFYATDPIAAEWLLKLENLSPNIWECACGQGHLAKVFENAGHNVYATDLIDRGYGIGGVDFLQTNKKWDGDIVTNPPYRYSQEFIEHSIGLINQGHKVCMFLKLQFLESQERRDFFKRYPPKTLYVSSKRINCGKNGVFNDTAMICYCWYVWEKGYNGDTILKWFN